MNKKTKIAMAAVSVVMAGTMAFGMFGCKKDNTPTPTPGPGVTNADLNLDDNGHLTYASTTELRLNVGNQKTGNAMGPSYVAQELGGTVKMPDGVDYNAGDLKPAWAALEKQLGLKLTDAFQNKGTDNQLTDPIDGTGGTMADYDIITASSSIMSQNTSELVDINQYLDYMPNYKAFLENNPVTRYSLTSDTTTGAMYYAPYYDGNDDIEKYCLAEQNWVTKLLDAADVSGATTTYAEQATAKSLTVTAAKVESYMGKTGSWTVKTTKPGTDTKATVDVTVDYDAVITELGKADSELAKAVKAAIGSAEIDKSSGNIVDIQNQMINATQGKVTGAQLLKVLQEYIKVAYKVDGAQLYGATVNGVQTKLSDVFNATYAAWDVDLLTALSRAVVTCDALLGAQKSNLNKLYGIAPRQSTTQRRADVIALAGELYGVRGMESRLEFLYVGADGNIHDARQDADSYDAVARLGLLSQEGLVYTGNENVDGKRTMSDSKKPSALLIHDYVQTQTKDCFTTTGLNIAPINTPVSKWDVDGNADNGHETVMRFTESWRSVKNSGFCISKAATYGKKDKLSACLAFIDYLFSNDGQLLMTYGPQSTNGNTNPNGFWYATEVEDAATSAKVEKVADETAYAPAQYKMKAENLEDGFVYNGKVYTGTPYNGTQVPTITDATMSFYAGEEVNGHQMGKEGDNVLFKEIYNYTNFARRAIGSTLPIGNKNQGFEYQGTAQCGLDGAANVAVSLLNGSIQHVKLSVADGESLWYMICPTSFALNSRQQSLLKDPAQLVISGTYFVNSSKTFWNIYIDLWVYGYNKTQNICNTETLGKMKETAAEYIAKVDEGDALTKRVNAYNQAWSRTKAYFEIG